MSGERAKRLAELFDRAADLDPAARARLLDAECAGDPTLRADVERLLAADSGPTAALLDRAVFEGQLRPGELVAGRYRVLRQVGAGGMGVVFEAEQLEPRRRVALKCLRSGYVDADLLQRFRREGQALGRLQHPGIAQVFEAGATDGEPPVPFLAMEFVDGEGLADAARDLPVRGKLELIAAIAEAVGHAHERGVVHRDLKPSNVLVERGSAGPRPRVLDFGVARFADGDPALRTRTHQIVGTLAYMSPEQLGGGSAGADPRSDVWSLGATAYELLAGRLPLPLADKSLAEAALVLRDEEPPPIERWVPALRGDVATIVHKALAKDPARRYANAAEFAADLRRQLAAQPIAARPASALYVATRLVRRHRGLFTGLAVAFVALATGLVAALVFAARATADRDRAERRTGELRELVRTLVRDVDAELSSVAGTIPARQMLLTAGQRYAAAMAAEAGDEPDLLLEVASLYEVLANVQGRPGSPNLGDPEGALASLGQALALVDRAKATAPDQSRLLVARQRLLRGRDSLLRTLGRAQERLANLQELQREVAAIARLSPGPAAEEAEVMAGADLGRLQADLGQFDAALANYERLLAFLERRVAEPAADPVDRRDDRSNRRIMLVQIGLLQERRGDSAAARASFERAVVAAEADAREFPGLNGARDLAGALRSHATYLLQKGEAEAALAPLQRARDLLAPFVATDADNYDIVRLACIVDFGIADALLQVGRRDEGIAAMRTYLQRLGELVGKHPQTQLARDLIPGRQSLAKELARAGRFDEAVEVAAAAVELAQQRATAPAADSMAQDDLLGSLGVQAFVHETAAVAPNRDEVARTLSRRAAAEALEAQLAHARALDEAGRLEPRRRSMLAELPGRIEALRGPQ